MRLKLYGTKHAAILFKKGIPEEVHIEDVMQVNGQWYVAGTSGVVLVVCGVGQTMRQVQAQAYSRTRKHHDSGYVLPR